MVEIIYGEHSEQADLAGRRVTEARHQYKPVFNIPDRAQAILNGKPVKKKLEAETLLNEGDELSFEEKSRKGLVLAGAFLLALAVTGGVFAYGYASAKVTLGVIAEPDWVTVSKSTTATSITWDVFGRYIGTLPTDSDLFDIATDANYTGDFEVRVYLTNTDELVKNYLYLNMKLELVDSSDDPIDEQGIYQATFGEGPHQILNLRNAEVTFFMKGYTSGVTYNVRLNGGNYKAHPKAWFTAGNEDPELWVEVTQSGL